MIKRAPFFDGALFILNRTQSTCQLMRIRVDEWGHGL